MHVISSGKVPANGLTSKRCVSQNFNKSLPREIIGVFGITGIFEGQLAGGRYKLPQGGIDRVVLKIYFHTIPARTLPEKSPSRVAREGDTPAKHT
jgi:hypothetical protein